MGQVYPKATVIIPTKDRPSGLRIAVQSALDACALTADCNVVVVDDRGSYKAVETLSDFSHENLTVVVNQRPPGPSGARNFGVDTSSSPTIIFLDDDAPRDLGERRRRDCGRMCPLGETRQ